MKKSYLPAIVIAVSFASLAALAIGDLAPPTTDRQNRVELPEGVKLIDESFDVTRNKLLQKTTRCVINGRGENSNVLALAELRIFSMSNYPELVKVDPTLNSRDQWLTLYTYTYNTAERKVVQRDSFGLLVLNENGSIVEDKNQVRTGNVIKRGDSSNGATVTFSADGKVKSVEFKERIRDSTLTFLLPIKGNSIKCVFE